MEWVDGSEQNKVDKCSRVCHEMRYVEWRGTLPTPMAREQGEGGEGGENAIPTENAFFRGEGSEEAHSPKNRTDQYPRHPHRQVSPIFYTCNAQTPSPVTRLPKIPSQSRPGRWVVVRRFQDFLGTNRRSHCTCPLDGIPARNCDASPLPYHSLRPLVAPYPSPPVHQTPPRKRKRRPSLFFEHQLG